MTKQEKIDEEYRKQGMVIISDNKNGWKLLELVEKDKLHLFDIKGQIARLKSLQGIENNNGWIKIESEAYLPKENKIYYVFDEETKGVYDLYFCPDDKTFRARNYQGSPNWEHITHFQEPILPQPPLY